MQLSSEQVTEVLKGVIDPNTQKDLVSSKAIKNVKVDSDEVMFDVVLGYPSKSQFDLIRKACISAVRELPGVKNVSVNISM